MLLTKYVEVKWSKKNKQHYKSFGYEFTEYGDVFVILVEHATMSNSIKVNVKCDYCGEIMQKPWPRYLQSHDEHFGDTCNKCKRIKQKYNLLERYGNENYRNAEQAKRTRFERYGDENYNNREQSEQTCLERYGVKHVSQVEGFGGRVKQTKLERHGDENYNNMEQNKQTKFERYGDEYYTNREQFEQTCLERYGVKNPLELEEVQNEIKSTNLRRYGVEYPFMSNEIQNKTEQTCVERYGVKHVCELPEVQDKAKQACFERYGVEHYFQSNEWLSSRKYSTITFSKPHQYIYGFLCGYYGCENVILENPVGKYRLDCAIMVDGIKIDVEYNGKYWHNGNEKYDNERRNYIVSEGYKVFNINSYRSVPTSTQIEEAINTLTTTNVQVITIDLDESDNK